MERNSKIELLRILSMFMIVLSHCSVHSGINFSSLPLGFNREILELSMLGNVGVILFIFITGYFSINIIFIYFSNIFLFKYVFFNI